MLIGYGIGYWFSKEYPAEKRKRNLLVSGLSLIALFIILRFVNKYGDPSPRVELNGWRSFLSFMNVSKYPPSLSILLYDAGTVTGIPFIVGKHKSMVEQNNYCIWKSSFLLLCASFLYHPLPAYHCILCDWSYNKPDPGSQFHHSFSAGRILVITWSALI